MATNQDQETDVAHSPFFAEVLAAKQTAEEAYEAVEKAVQQAKTIMEDADQAAKEAKDKANGGEKPTLGIRKETLIAVRELVKPVAESVRKAREASERAEVSARKAIAAGDTAAEAVARDAASAATRAENAANDLNKLEKDAKKESDAALAVEVYLNVAPFFTHYEDEIYARLEECDDIANRAGERGGMVFIAEGLPIINGIIYIGAKRDDLSLAKKWVRETWGEDAHPRIVLSALMFIYVADLGVVKFKDDEKFKDDKEKQEKWERIHRRVHNLL